MNLKKSLVNLAVLGATIENNLAQSINRQQTRTPNPTFNVKGSASPEKRKKRLQAKKSKRRNRK